MTALWISLLVIGVVVIVVYFLHKRDEQKEKERTDKNWEEYMKKERDRLAQEKEANRRMFAERSTSITREMTSYPYRKDESSRFDPTPQQNGDMILPIIIAGSLLNMDNPSERKKDETVHGSDGGIVVVPSSCGGSTDSSHSSDSSSHSSSCSSHSSSCSSGSSSSCGSSCGGGGGCSS